MVINVSGAGAGKTTNMADCITKFDIPNGKIIFCMAFTNSAVENIEKHVILKLGKIPNNIQISTIHSFLYHELIKPYYFFLFGKQYKQLSTINLPNKDAYKGFKISELEKEGLLHYSKIPERAKWVAYKKSTDTKETRKLRSEILSRFSDYCAGIFVDEAQDVEEDIKYILQSLESNGVQINLYGDPKQDVKGSGQFRRIIDISENVNYIPDCYRCPQKHLNLSNILASPLEKQIAKADNTEGSINLVFESDIDNVKKFINAGEYGLQYISKKHERFSTHEKYEKEKSFVTLQFEVHKAMAKKYRAVESELQLKRDSFFLTEQISKAVLLGNRADEIIKKCVKVGAFDELGSKQYAQMVSVINTEQTKVSNEVVVRSIEIIKGLEDKRCLFILTTDLSPYLFREKTEDNKQSHLLYVALTRSLDSLTIFITKEVENKHGRSKIIEFFSAFLS